MDLDNLFNAPNPKCEGCSILADKSLPTHSEMDYEGKEPVDVLFISDSLKLYQGDWLSFRPGEFKVIKNELSRFPKGAFTVGFTASVKCPNITDKNIKAKDRKICRVHLEDSLRQYKPKLVFACGKLATTMLYGKNVDDKKGRGRIDDLDLDGLKFKSMPVIHPFMVIVEPKNAFLFTTDIQNGINSVILGNKVESSFGFEIKSSIDELEKVLPRFMTENPVSIDVETTGLNFLEDTIHTIAFTVFEAGKYYSISVPWDHRENKQGYQYKAAVAKFTKAVCGNRKNRKVLQGGKFDLKFLRRYGITEVYNIWDTKLMFNIVKEDTPRSLKDLVSYFFPGESII